MPQKPPEAISESLDLNIFRDNTATSPMIIHLCTIFCYSIIIMITFQYNYEVSSHARKVVIIKVIHYKYNSMQNSLLSPFPGNVKSMMLLLPSSQSIQKHNRQYHCR